MVKNKEILIGVQATLDEIDLHVKRGEVDLDELHLDTKLPTYPSKWIEGTKVAIKKYGVGDCRRIGRVVNVDTSKKPFIYSIETDYSASSGSYLEEELTDVFDKTVDIEIEDNSKLMAIMAGLFIITMSAMFYLVKYRI